MIRFFGGGLNAFTALGKIVQGNLRFVKEMLKKLSLLENTHFKVLK